MTEKETDMLRLTNTTAAFTLFATTAMADPAEIITATCGAVDLECWEG